MIIVRIKKIMSVKYFNTLLKYVINTMFIIIITATVLSGRPTWFLTSIILRLDPSPVQPQPLSPATRACTSRPH